MQGPGVDAPGLVGGGDRGSLAAAPVPSLTVAWAAPPLWSAGLDLGHHRLDPGGPERDAGAVLHRPGVGDQPGDLDWMPLAEARGHAGHLDGQDLSLAVAQGDQLDDVKGLAVL